jgi:hypothetical protein
MGLTITPLSAMVISALGNERFGLASGINSAVSRLASVLAVAFLAMGGIAAMVLLRDHAADARPLYRIADKGAPRAVVSEK